MLELCDEATGRSIRGHGVPRSFFLQPPEIVARALLGKILVRRWRGQWLAGRLVEAEAYRGLEDPAAHAFAGKTARNAVLFGPPGYAYVYSIYGMHFCLNVSCQPEQTAGCVLLRGLEPLQGVAAMRRNRGLAKDAAIRMLASGPGKLCAAMAITRAGENGAELTATTGKLFFLDDGCTPENISITPRVGIRKATDWPLRFFVTGNTCVSRNGR